jgi:hypothetical protein
MTSLHSLTISTTKDVCLAGETITGDVIVRFDSKCHPKDLCVLLIAEESVDFDHVTLKKSNSQSDAQSFLVKSEKCKKAKIHFSKRFEIFKFSAKHEVQPGEMKVPFAIQIPMEAKQSISGYFEQPHGTSSLIFKYSLRAECNLSWDSFSITKDITVGHSMVDSIKKPVLQKHDFWIQPKSSGNSGCGLCSQANEKLLSETFSIEHGICKGGNSLVVSYICDIPQNHETLKHEEYHEHHHDSHKHSENDPSQQEHLTDNQHLGSENGITATSATVEESVAVVVDNTHSVPDHPVTIPSNKSVSLIRIVEMKCNGHTKTITDTVSTTKLTWSVIGSHGILDIPIHAIASFEGELGSVRYIIQTPSDSKYISTCQLPLIVH